MLTKCIVTGHTKGLGAAIAGWMLKQGMPVLGLSRGRADWPSAGSRNLLSESEVDLSELAALDAWLTSGTLERFVADAESLILFNNAGTVQPIGPLPLQSETAVGRAVMLNVAAPLVLASALTRLSGSRELRIVHISSGAARNAYAGWSVYCATKAALDHHARAVAMDGMTNVRICSLAPGVVDTAMQAEVRQTTLEQFPSMEKFQQLKQNGQLSSPDDAARILAAYVMGPEFGTSPVADIRNV